MNICVYADGSCLGNPGPGGLGVVVVEEGHEPFLWNEPWPEPTTNNRMELAAVIAAMRLLLFRYGQGTNATILTDSEYVAKNLAYLSSWQARGWRKADGKPVLNAGFWMVLAALKAKLDVQIKYVEGHAGNVWQEKAHTLAQRAANAAKEVI